MKVLVTGGTGFVGAHLVRRLLSRGHEVTSLDKHPGLAYDELRALGAVLVTGSVTDPADVEQVMPGQELVYHLASPFGDILQPDEAYWAIEVEGTRNVLEAAERHAVRRVVHCSTQGVHGIIEQPPGDEDSPMAPKDYYCYTKVEGERVVQEFQAKGMDIAIVRPTSVYGPGDTRGWLKLYQLVTKGWFLMIGSGRTFNHPVYIDNLVDLFELVGTAPQGKGRVYLAGDDRPVTLTDLVRSVGRAVGSKVRIFRFPWYPVAWLGASAVETVCRLIGVNPPVFRRRLSWFKTNRAFRIDRARDELGYHPRVRLQEGLARTAEWYRQHGYLPAVATTGTASAGARLSRGDRRGSARATDRRQGDNRRSAPAVQV